MSTPKGILVNGYVLLKVNSETEALLERGYGIIENGYIKLKPVEALFLLHHNKIEVYSSDKKLNFSELFDIFSSLDPELYVKYMVYEDLRKRGFVVKEGFSKRAEFRLYEGYKQSKVAKYLVNCFVEGKRIDLRLLAQIVDEALRSEKELILAIVDKEGNISYYSVTKFIPKYSRMK